MDNHLPAGVVLWDHGEVYLMALFTPAANGDGPGVELRRVRTEDDAYFEDSFELGDEEMEMVIREWRRRHPAPSEVPDSGTGGASKD